MTAAILAGGEARRLGGRDKSRLTLEGRSILARQLDALREAGAAPEDITIIANDQASFADTGLRVVPDVVPGAGALGGLYSALLSSTTDRTVVIACDLPFLTAPFLQLLDRTGADADATVPHTRRGYEPLCASYARRCAPTLRRRLDAGRWSLVDCLRELRVRELTPDEVAPYDPHGLLFFNINTPDAYADACEAVTGRAGSEEASGRRESYRSIQVESNTRESHD